MIMLLRSLKGIISKYWTNSIRIHQWGGKILHFEIDITITEKLYYQTYTNLSNIYLEWLILYTAKPTAKFEYVNICLFRMVWSKEMSCHSHITANLCTFKKRHMLYSDKHRCRTKSILNESRYGYFCFKCIDYPNLFEIFHTSWLFNYCKYSLLWTAGDIRVRIKLFILLRF
jgi:hypothetical protein